jgi:hypothetical protein
MHVRESRVKKGSKTYRYVQLVESFRRKDGMPTQRVVASFGDLSESQTETVRLFAKALSGDIALRLDGDAVAPFAGLKVLDNLQYLHLAVLLEIWRKSGLDELLRRVLGDPGPDVSTADVVTALVLHRCVAADSKLAAERWFPTTALPELFGWAASKFNNSRLHRSLELLEARDDAVQAELPGVVRGAYGPASAVLLDGTDTWFEGQGPDMASMGRVKDGSYRRKILIVVACDHRGFPLRWRSYEGNKSEVHALREVAVDLAARSWLGDAPLIADRALGNYASLEILASTGRNFLVPVPEHEVSAWVPRLAGLPLDISDRTAAVDAIKGMGFTGADGKTFVADGARFTVEVPLPTEPMSVLGEATSAPTRIAAALAQARQLRGGGSSGALAAQLGVSKSHVTKLLSLLQLPVEVQLRIDAGEGPEVALSGLVGLLRGQTDEQARCAAFDALVTAQGRKGKLRGQATHRAAPARRSPIVPRSTVGRPIVYFNPDMFVEQRHRAHAELAEVRAAVSAVGLGDGEPALRGRIDRILRDHGMPSLFEVEVAATEGGLVATLKLQEADWTRRRRFDGFSVLIASPALAGNPAQLVDLYRTRDQIERDFRTIKSVVELRPVHHRTDAKVRAHVTICVLATLLHRLLDHHLAVAGAETSAVAAIAQLGLCHINRIRSETNPVVAHTVTQVHGEVRKLLSSLDLMRLVDDAHVGAVITPR